MIGTEYKKKKTEKKSRKDVVMGTMTIVMLQEELTVMTLKGKRRKMQVKSVMGASSATKTSVIEPGPRASLLQCHDKQIVIRHNALTVSTSFSVFYHHFSHFLPLSECEFAYKNSLEMIVKNE